MIIIIYRSPTLSDLQAEAALALTKCQKIARRKLEAEKLRREIEEAQKLRNLIGRDIGKRLCKESLEQLNSPTLQVVNTALPSMLCKIVKTRLQLRL